MVVLVDCGVRLPIKSYGPNYGRKWRHFRSSWILTNKLLYKFMRCNASPNWMWKQEIILAFVWFQSSFFSSSSSYYFETEDNHTKVIKWQRVRHTISGTQFAFNWILMFAVRIFVFFFRNGFCSIKCTERVQDFLFFSDRIFIQ